MVPANLRFAAGVCLLAGLLVGGAGGAVALAEPNSSTSPAPTHGDTSASEQSSTGASNPAGEAADTARTATEGEKSPLGSGQQPSTGAETPTKEPGGTNTTDEKKDSDLVTAVPNTAAPATDVAAPPAPNTAAPATDVAAPPVPDVAAPVTDVVAPPVPDVAAPATDVAAPPVPEMVAPVTDVVGRGIGRQRRCWAAGDRGCVDRVRNCHCSYQSPVPRALPLAGNTTGLETSRGTAPSTFGATSRGDRASSPLGIPPLASIVANPMGVPSLLWDAYSELPIPVAVSLSTLAAIALPGVGGLVIVTLAGVRIGYRQAKAGFAVRTAGIARFARVRPLGIVRPRALRVERPEALSAGYLLDKAA